MYRIFRITATFYLHAKGTRRNESDLPDGFRCTSYSRHCAHFQAYSMCCAMILNKHMPDCRLDSVTTRIVVRAVD